MQFETSLTQAIETILSNLGEAVDKLGDHEEMAKKVLLEHQK